MEENKYLKNARQAMEEGNTEDAKRFYEMVKMDDPDNGEAKFFYAYFSLYEGRNMDIPRRFDILVKTVVPSVQKVASSSDSEEEKLNILTMIVDTFVPETWNLNRYMNRQTVGSGSNISCIFEPSDIMEVSKRGMQLCYELGNAIEKCFPNNSEAIKLALKSWKEGVTLQQKWYAFGTKGDPEKYTEIIKKYEPSYEMPKKAGCISLADSKSK